MVVFGVYYYWLGQQVLYIAHDAQDCITTAIRVSGLCQEVALML